MLCMVLAIVDHSSQGAFPIYFPIRMNKKGATQRGLESVDF